ncbi:MAG: tyrosine-type recombinase/integrase, partial [Planctomycetes bacterium]|nr:tyrosine-type recombinase/integrase [Planctomycetota bacterium]
MSARSQDCHPEVTAFITYLRDERNMSSHTLRNYAVDLEQFVHYLKKNQKIDQFPQGLEPLTIRGFLAIMDENGVSKRTVARKLAALRSFYKFLRMRGKIVNNPITNIRSPRIEKKLPIYLTIPQVEALLAAPEKDSFIGLRDRAIMELLYSAGLRSAELVGLDEGDLNFADVTVRVQGKGGKERINPVGRYAAQAVEEYLTTKRIYSSKMHFEEKALFVNKRGGRLTTRSIRRILVRYAL